MVAFTSTYPKPWRESVERPFLSGVYAVILENGQIVQAVWHREAWWSRGTIVQPMAWLGEKETRRV